MEEEKLIRIKKIIEDNIVLIDQKIESEEYLDQDILMKKVEYLLVLNDIKSELAILKDKVEKKMQKEHVTSR